MNMMGAIGKMTRNSDWGKLDAWDRFILEKYGVTEKDYKLFQLAKTDQYRGCEMLTRGAIEEISDADLAKPEPRGMMLKSRQVNSCQCSPMKLKLPHYNRT